MELRKLNDANLDLVETRRQTPHCKIHGVMNAVASFKTGIHGGKIWRCVSTISDQNDNTCRAGCEQHGLLTVNIRKEVHTRQTFAYEMAEKWMKSINHNKNGGNILMGKATHKFLQARRIYIYYANEFQKYQCLPLSK